MGVQYIWKMPLFSANSLNRGTAFFRIMPHPAYPDKERRNERYRRAAETKARTRHLRQTWEMTLKQDVSVAMTDHANDTRCIVSIIGLLLLSQCNSGNPARANEPGTRPVATDATETAPVAGGASTQPSTMVSPAVPSAPASNYLTNLSLEDLMNVQASARPRSDWGCGGFGDCHHPGRHRT